MAKERDDQNQPQPKGESPTPRAQPPEQQDDVVNLGDLPSESGAPRTDATRKPQTQIAKPDKVEEATSEAPRAPEPPAKGPAPDTMVFMPDEATPPAPESPLPLPNLSLDQPHETIVPTPAAAQETPPAPPPAPESPLPLPNLSLDEPDEEPIVAEPVEPAAEGSHVLQAEPVSGTGGSSVIEAIPLDDSAKPPSSLVEIQPLAEEEEVLQAEPVKEKPSSATAKSDSDVFLDEFTGPDSGAKVPKPPAGESDIVEAQPLSGLESGVVEAEAASDVVEAQPASGVESGVIEAEAASGIVEAEPVSGLEAQGHVLEGDVLDVGSGAKSGDKPASNLDEVEEVTSGVVPAQPGSSIFEAEPASSVFEAEALSMESADDVLGEVEEVVPGEEASSGEVVAAEAVEDEDSTSSATRRQESVLGEADVPGARSGSKPGQPESPVVFEEDVVEEVEGVPESGVAPRSKQKAQQEEEVTEEADVLSAEEVGATGSSAVDWDDVEEISSATRKGGSGAVAEVVEDDEEDVLAGHAVGDSEEDSSAVDLGKSHGAKNGPSASGIDPVAEALESGVNLDDEDVVAGAGKDEPSVEFDELLTDDGAEVTSKPGAKKVKKTLPADDEDVLEPAVSGELGTDEEDVFGGDDHIMATDAGSAEEVAEAEAASAVEAEEAEAVEAEEADEAEEAAVVDDEESSEVAFTSDEAEATTDFDVEDRPAPKSKKKAKAAAFDEDEAEATLDGDEAEAAAVVDEDEEEAEAAAVVDEGEDAVAVGADEDEAAEAVEDEEGELVGAGAGRDKKKKGPPAEPAPQRGRAVPLLGGTLLGVLLAVGAGGGLWYFSPGTMKQLEALHPDYKAPAPPLPAATQLQKATEMLAAGSYDQVINQLNGKTTPTELAALGEARWLKYLKEQGEKKAPLKADDADVKQAREELSKADKDHPILKQIDKTIEADKLALQVAKLEESDKALSAVRDELVKAKVADESAKVEELPKAIGQALNDKQEAEKVKEGIGQALADAKLIEDKKNLDVPTFQKVLKDLGDQKATLTAVNKLLKGADVKDMGEKGVEAVLAARKDAEDKLNEVDKILTDAKLKDPGAKGVQELVDARTKLEKERDELNTAVKTAVEELAEGKIITPGADPRKDLVAGAKQARQRAESPLAIPLTHLGGSLAGLGASVGHLIENGLASARVGTELAYYRVREPLIATPEAQLDTRIAILQDRGRKDAREIEAVLREADWLLSKDAGAIAEVRGKAHYAKGLALRSQEKYAEAKTELQEAVQVAKTLPKAGPWAEQAAQAHKELTDPTGYYLPRVERDLAAGNTAQAMAEVNLALKVIPDSGLLRAERAMVQLAEARQKGKIADAQKQIRADAEAGRKDAPAPADFVLGQLEEDLGNLDAAEQHYRAAIKANQASKGPVAEAYRYRIALARLLQRDRSAVEVAPEPAERPKEEKAEKAEEKTSSLRPAEFHPLTGLVVAAVIGAQPAEEEESPKAKARLDESIKLAEELLESDDPKVKGQGHILLGEALSKRGKRTEGLREVAKGMKLLHPGLPSEELDKLLNEHPAFQHPDVSKEPNPEIAEKFFGLGVNHYWEGRYKEAEAQLKQAVGYFDQDARYQYFLGLAQLGQGTKLKRDQAYFSFEKGARLEAAGRPGVAEVSVSLERVQGNLRQLLNEIRIGVLTKTLPE